MDSNELEVMAESFADKDLEKGASDRWIWWLRRLCHTWASKIKFVCPPSVTTQSTTTTTQSTTTTTQSPTTTTQSTPTIPEECEKCKGKYSWQKCVVNEKIKQTFIEVMKAAITSFLRNFSICTEMLREGLRQ